MHFPHRHLQGLARKRGAGSGARPARGNELGAEYLLTQDLNTPESLAVLGRAQADVGVSVNWINLVGAAACEAFRFGILNAHAGDLPRYRGNAPIAWAILQGESRIGITIHQMLPGELDAGPILTTDHFPLDNRVYIGEVFGWLRRRMPLMFVEAIEGLGDGTLRPQPQPGEPSLALRCYPRQPKDGLIHWSATAAALSRLVRARAEPFAGAFTIFRGRRLVVWRASAEPWDCPSLAVPGQVVGRDPTSGELRVATGDGVLVLEEIQLDGEPRLAPANFIKSLHDRLG